MSRPIPGWSVRAVPTQRRQVLAGGEITAELYRTAINHPQLGMLEARFPGWRTTHVRRLANLERDLAALAAAQLFWVATDMAAQALDASQDLPGFTVADFVTPIGLVLFEQPLPEVPTGSLTEYLDPGAGQPGRTWTGQAPLWALSWYPDLKRPLYRVTAYTRVGDLPFRIAPHAELQGLWELTVPTTADGVVFSDDDQAVFHHAQPGGYSTTVQTGGDQAHSSHGVLAFLAAMNILMNTPTLAHHRDLDARTGKPPTPATTVTDQVAVIDLRPLRYEETPTDSPTGRTYQHRWVVRGHWALQPHGPKQSLRKRIYREPYIKGPPDAPLLATERVYAWRR